MMKELCEAYLGALNEGDLDRVLSLFTEGAVVSSPLYGEIPATVFYKDLFADTRKSETTLLHVFTPTDDSSSVALHFHYAWTLQSGSVVDFECVDVFDVSLDDRKFTKLCIIYDTYPLRDEHSKSRSTNNG